MKPAAYPRSFRYHLWRIRHAAYLLWIDVREALDEAWDWVRIRFLARPLAFHSYDFGRPSNATKRERIDVHVTDGSIPRMVDAYLIGIQPRPWHTTADRRSW